VRIDEGDRLRQQLQRLVDGIRAVKDIPAYRHAECCELHAQLVFAPGDRTQRQPPSATFRQHVFDPGFRVRWPRHFAHARKSLTRNDAAVSHPRFRQRWRGFGQCKVAFVDPALRKQGLIRRARRRVGRQQHEPGGVPIDTVQRREIGEIERSPQPKQQRLLQITAGGQHRQTMGLVRHHQKPVSMQHGGLCGDRPFCRQ